MLEDFNLLQLENVFVLINFVILHFRSLNDLKAELSFEMVNKNTVTEKGFIVI